MGYGRIIFLIDFKLRMQVSFLFFALLAVLLVMAGTGCLPAKQLSEADTPSVATQDVSSTIVRQEGLIGTFPTDAVALLGKKSVMNSLRNEMATSTQHEVEYVSDIGVTSLYSQFKSELTGAAWTEQNPQSQQVGAIQVATGTFVSGQDTITVAIQTAVGEEKQQGLTQVKLVVNIFH